MSFTVSTYRSSDCPHTNGFVGEDNGLGALFRDYGEEYIKIYKPDIPQIKLIRSIRICKTPYLGGKAYRCKGCDSVKYVYYSCGHSQCPKCQGMKRLKWQEKLRVRLLNVPYQHIIYTMPHQLNSIARRNPKQIYNILFRSMWRSLRQTCERAENVGGKPGVIAVLHTFGSDLKYHVHLHCLVTFGGLDKQGKWHWPKRKKKLSGYRKLRKAFQQEFEEELGSVYEELETKIGIEALQSELGKKQWCVHCRPPTSDTQIIEEYLSRYINRIGVSKSKFKYDQVEQQVLLTYNDYRNQKEGKAAPKDLLKLEPLVALGQILQHVLPAYFQKCRYYGLHAPASAKKMATELPQSISNNGKTIRTLMQIIKAIIGIEGFPCKECGSVEWEEKEELRKDKKWLETFLVIPSSRGDPERTPYMKPNKDFSLFEKPLPYARNNKKGQKLQAFSHQQRG